MLFIFASTFGSSARISVSPGIDGPGVTIQSIRPLLLAVPVVVDPLALPDVVLGDPDEFAVPKVFLPGGADTFAE
jgi:hypothetical protein